MGVYHPYHDKVFEFGAYLFVANIPPAMTSDLVLILLGDPINLPVMSSFKGDI